MLIERLPIKKTSEEIKEARGVYQQEIESQVNEQNSLRSVLDRIAGRNKIDPIDIAHEDSLQENRKFDTKQAAEQEAQARQEILSEVHKQESASALAGEWDRQRSRFYFSQDHEQQTWLEEMSMVNTEALEQKYILEQKMVEAGEWNPQQSVLFVPAYSRTEVNDLKQEKHTFFKKLEDQYKQRKELHEKALKEELQLEMEQHFTEEKQAIDSGTWSETESYFKAVVDGIRGDQAGPDLNHPELSKYVMAMKKLDELREFESKILTEAERERVAQAYSQESKLAGQGNWKEEGSYFVEVQNKPQFEKLDQELKYKIRGYVSSLALLSMQVNFSKGHSTNSEVVPNKETILREMHELVGVGSDASSEEFEKAYRRFAMKNHPDRTGGDAEAEARLSRFSRLQQNLKKIEQKADRPNPA